MSPVNSAGLILLPLGAHNIRAKRPKPALNVLVAAVYNLRIADHGLAFGAERSEQERHSSADVGA